MRLDLAAHVASGFGHDELRSIEGAVGGGGKDLLLGDGRRNYFEDWGGRGLINGRGGRDTIGAKVGSRGICSGGSNPLRANLAKGTARWEDWAPVALVSIENARGDWDDDILKGDAIRNRLVGGGGNDTIHGRGGSDTLIGDGQRLFPGRDTLRGGGGADTLDGGPRHDDLDGGTGTNRNDGGLGTDRCIRPSAAHGALHCEET